MNFYKLSILCISLFTTKLTCSEARPTPWGERTEKIFLSQLAKSPHKSYTFDALQRYFVHITWITQESLEDTTATVNCCLSIPRFWQTLVPEILSHATNRTLHEELTRLSTTIARKPIMLHTEPISPKLFLALLKHTYHHHPSTPYPYSDPVFHTYNEAFKSILYYIVDLLTSEENPILVPAACSPMETILTQTLWHFVFTTLTSAVPYPTPAGKENMHHIERTFMHQNRYTIIYEIFKTLFSTLEGDRLIEMRLAGARAFIAETRKLCALTLPTEETPQRKESKQKLLAAVPDLTPAEAPDLIL